MEADILQIRAAVKATEKAHAESRAEADKLRSEMRESGVDFVKDADAFARLDEAYKVADAKRDELTELRSREGRLLEIVGERADAPAPSTDRAEAQSIAKRYMTSAAYREIRDSGVLEMEGARVNGGAAQVATRDELRDMLRIRTTVDNSSGSGGGRIWSDRLESLLVALPVRNVRLLDVISVGDTDSDTVEWANETTVTDAAAETAYGTAAPESAYGYTKTSTTVKRLPAFVPATKGALMDGGQLESLLSNRLARGVRLRAESQILGGNGTGENLSGIVTACAAGANLVQAKATDSYFDCAHKAITQVRTNYFEDPTVIGLHPTDFESILLEKDANGNYVHGRAASEGTVQTIWGLNPVVSTVFSQGTAWVGDFTQAQLWMRTGLTIATSDQHQDFFIKGLVAILAEMRAAFAVLQTKAFVKVTGL